MIKFEDFKTITLELTNTIEKQDKIAESVATEYREALFYNDYIGLEQQMNEMLLKMLVGDSLFTELLWYLYDRPSNSPKIESRNGEYMIYTLDDFFNFIEKEYYGK